MKKGSKRNILFLVILCFSGFEAQEIEYDTGGNPTLVRFLNHKVVYSSNKKLLVGDFGTNKILFESKIHVEKYNLLEIPKNKPFAFLSGISPKIVKTGLIKDKNPEEISLKKIPLILKSDSEFLYIGYKNSVQRLRLENSKLDLTEIKFEKETSELGDFVVLGNLLIMVSKSTAETVVINTSDENKIVNRFLHEMDHTVKLEKISEKRFIMWGLHRKFQFFEIRENGFKILKEKKFQIDQNERDYHLRDKYSGLIIYQGGNYAAAFSKNNNIVSILNLKEKSELRKIQLEQEVKEIVGIYSEIDTNLLAVMVKKSGKKKYFILGFKVPEIFDCDSCPFCTSAKKQHCALCSNPGSIWVDKECLDCSKKNSKRSQKCVQSRSFNISVSKDVYYQEKNYFDIVFQNQQEIFFQLSNKSLNWDKFFHLELVGLSKESYRSEIKYFEGKLRLDISLKANGGKKGQEGELDFFKGRMNLVASSEKFNLTKRKNIYLKNFLAKIEPVELKNYSWMNKARKIVEFSAKIFNFISLLTPIIMLINLFISVNKGSNLVVDTSFLLITMKQLYYLKFINSDFGILTSIFMENLKNSYLEVYSKKADQVLYGGNLGKIDFEKMRSLSFQVAIFPMIFLLSIWIYSVIYSLRYSKYRTIMQNETNEFQRVGIRHSIWEYLNYKCGVLFFIAQDLSFWFSVDLILNNFYLGKMNNFKTAFFFLTSLFLVNRLMFEIYTKFAKINFFKTGFFSKNELDSESENFEIKESIITKEEAYFEIQIEENPIKIENIRLIQKLKIYSSGIKKTQKNLNFLTQNFNLIFLSKSCIQILTLVTLTNFPNLQTLLLFKMESSFLYFLLKIKNEFKQDIFFFKHFWASLGYLTFALQSFFFTKNNSYYNLNLRKHYTIITFEFISLVSFGVSILCGIVHILMKYQKKKNNRVSALEQKDGKSQNELDESQLRDLNFEEMENGGESFESIPRIRSRHNTRPTFLESKIPNYSIRSKVSRGSSSGNNISDEKVEEFKVEEEKIDEGKIDGEGFDNSRINLNLSDDSDDLDESFNL